MALRVISTMSSPITSLDSDRTGDQIDNTGRLVTRIPFLLVLLAAVVFFLPLLVEGTTYYPFDTLRDYFPWQGLLPGGPSHNPLITDPINVISVRRPSISPTITFRAPCNTAGCPGGSPPSSEECPSTTICRPSLRLVFASSPSPWPTTCFSSWALQVRGLHLPLLAPACKLHPIAALFGALAWTFNGYVMVWFEFEHIVALALCLPAALYFTEVLLERRAWTTAWPWVCVLAPPLP
jgi:hypothetical protein